MDSFRFRASLPFNQNHLPFIEVFAIKQFYYPLKLFVKNAGFLNFNDDFGQMNSLSKYPPLF